VPLATVAGWLRIDVLWSISFAVGVLAVVFDIAVTSYVPALVERGQLVDANATLQASGAAARVAGPGTGGWLVQAVGAPFAVTADALSFVVAAALLTRLRVADDFSRPERRGVWTEIYEGLDTVWRDRILRAMVLSTTIGALGGSVQQAERTSAQLSATTTIERLTGLSNRDPAWHPGRETGGRSPYATVSELDE
jgi:MFS family permease